MNGFGLLFSILSPDARIPPFSKSSLAFSYFIAEIYKNFSMRLAVYKPDASKCPIFLSLPRAVRYDAL